MVKYRIEIGRVNCIACEACYSLDSLHFEADEEGISKVVGGKTNEKLSSGTFNDDEIELVKQAEDYCPVSVIIITTL